MGESESLAPMVKKSSHGKKPSNPVVPGMPNAIKSKGGHDHQQGGMIITDTDIRFDNQPVDPTSGYTSAQQVVMAGRPVTWSMSTSSQIQSLRESVNHSVSNEFEAKAFDRNAEETRNLAFSAVPFLPWEASKILPIEKFDANDVYVPTKLNFNSPVAKESIVDDHAVLQNPALTRKFKNFNRTACGFGKW